MDDQTIEYNARDQVQLRTTRQVRYRSHSPGQEVSPHGIWTIAAIISGQLLLTKEGATILIPVSDVQMYRKYSIDQLDIALKGIL